MKQHLCDHIYTYDASDGNSSYQATDFYPFGYAIDRGWAFLQPYKFGGKELDDMHGLQMYDQSARFFGADLPITWSMDPLLEKYYSMSPYCQMGNNPVRFNDPDGRAPGDYYDTATGEHVYNDGISDDKVYSRETKTIFTPGGMFGGSVAITTTTDTELKVSKSDIPDKTVEFTAQLEATNDFFSNQKDEHSGIGKLLFFAGQVGNGTTFDLKTQDGSFNENTKKNWGDGHAFFDGKLFRADDFGNFNFGVAAKAFGISEDLGLLGAGVTQIIDHFGKGSPVGGILSYGDDPKDNSMIKQGYQYYNANFK